MFFYGLLRVNPRNDGKEKRSFLLCGIFDSLFLTFCLTKKLQKVKAVPDSRPTTSLLAKQNKLATNDAQTELCF
jgi:hypothetical protein